MITAYFILSLVPSALVLFTFYLTLKEKRKKSRSKRNAVKIIVQCGTVVLIIISYAIFLPNSEAFINESSSIAEISYNN